MSEVQSSTAPRSRLLIAALPLVVFLGIALLLGLRLGAGDASKLPSALIGKPAPALNLAGLDGAKGLADADLRAGHVTLVNIFASWCQPCHVEHEFLAALAADADLKSKGVTIVGIAQKDTPEKIKRFLNEGGNPYAQIGMDPENRAGIDWGVYGVPETFIVRGDGVIAYKYVGPIDAEAIEKTIKPEIAKAQKPS